MAERSKAVAHRDGWVTAGLVVSAVSAAVSSFSGLHSLALVTGWPMIFAPLLPACIDSYAVTSVRVWLASTTRSERARRFARWNAVGAILLSLAGNAVSHLISAHLVAVSWYVVLAVGAVPPVILGLVVELAVLRGQVDQAWSEPAENGDRPPDGQAPAGSTPVLSVVPPLAAVRTSQPAVRTPDGPRYASEDELQMAARAADQAHRARTGRAISRDELRRQLGISGARATAIARWLKQERAAAADGT